MSKAAKEDSLDARSARTREALRSALLMLLKDRSFEQIRARDIAAQAGKGYATFFRQYETKASLLEDLAAAEIRQLVEKAMPLIDAPDTRAVCLALCSYVDEHRALWKALLVGGAAAAMREEFLRISIDLAIERAPDSSWLPADLGVTYGASGILEVLSWWLRQTEGMPVERVAEILDRLAITPLTQAGVKVTGPAGRRIGKRKEG